MAHDEQAGARACDCDVHAPLVRQETHTRAARTHAREHDDIRLTALRKCASVTSVKVRKQQTVICCLWVLHCIAKCKPHCKHNSVSLEEMSSLKKHVMRKPGASTFMVDPTHNVLKDLSQ